MKTLALFFVMIFSASAETFVFGESYRTIKKDSAHQTQVLWGQQDLSKKVGIFGWAQYGKSYRQAYGGLSVRPTSWLQVGAGTGVEQATSKARIAGFYFTSKGRFSSYGVYENGGSGYWYLAISTIAINKYLNFGSHSQAFIGHGVRTEVKLPSIGRWTPSIRPAFTWNKSGRPNVIIGLRMTYFKGE